MQFVSTRGLSEPLSFTEAVAMGLAPDGGLYVPQALPDISGFLKDWESLSYVDLCTEFFKLFATDLEEQAIETCARDAYSGFTHEAIAPMVTLEKRLHVLELFHGPTLAFKDFALQFLGNLYGLQIERTGNPVNVLGATSGDTGAAAIHGLLKQDQVNLFILYPDGGVSPLQERQMTCTGAENVHAIRINGSFDDAQTTIKAVFGDMDFRRKQHLSAVNSINLARILAQCVYYIHAWCQLPPGERDSVTFVVPTGNFGNVLAGWLTQKMGLPLKGFRIATNQNDILHRLFTTGCYEVQTVHASHAPSMDIQIASNFERFLFYHEGRDPARVRRIMETFKDSGVYQFEDFDRDTFSSCRATDESIRDNIKAVYRKFGYIIDPHTACGFEDLPEEGTRIVLGTAHPAKFPDVIEESIGEHPTAPALESLKALSPVSYPLEPDPETIKEFIQSQLETRS